MGFVHFFSHPYSGREVKFIYDTESGSLHNADGAAFVIAKSRYGEKLSQEERELCAALPPDEKAEIDKALDDLEWAGTLNKSFVAPRGKSRPQESIVKALCLHICHDCNMRCAYCFANEGTYNSAAREKMSLEVGKRAIDFLIKNSGSRHNLEVDFFGGEPLLNFDVVQDIVKYAREREAESGKKFLFTMTTNCLLLRGGKAEWLNEQMHNVVLSLDGRKEVNDAVRKLPGGGGAFDVVMKNAQAFVKMRGGKSYYIRGTYTAKNLDFTKDVEFLHKAGFEQISVEPVVTDIPELKIEEKHLPQIFAEYDKLADYVVQSRKEGRYINFFHFMCDLKSGPCLTKRISGCGSGVSYLAVLPGGELYPCHRFAGEAGYLMGSVLTGELSRGVTPRFLGNAVTQKPDCVKCFAKYHCGGGCAANNLAFSGRLDGVDPLYCAMMKKRFELALFVNAADGR